MSSGLAACGISTSEELIQVLKRRDAPDQSRISKVNILHSAWRDESVYVPRKLELLLDCTLDLMATSAKHGKGEQHFMNAEYWGLLAEMVQSTANDGDFLHAIVSRHNILALVATVAASTSDASKDMWVCAAHALAVLIPASILRTGATHIDAVNACFRDLMHVIPAVCEPRTLDVHRHLWTAITIPWASALSLGTNAKKSAKFFVANTLPHYAKARWHCEGLSDELDHVAALSLYNEHNTRTLPESVDTLVSELCPLSREIEGQCIVVPLLRRLVAHTCPAERMHAPPASIRHAIVERFLAPVATTLVEMPQQLTTLLALVRTVETSALYQPGGDDETAWTALWRTLISYTLGTDGASAYNMLRALWTLCPEEVLPHMTQVWTRTTQVDASAFEAARAFVEEVMMSLVNERRMPHLIRLVCDALRGASCPFAQLVQTPLLCSHMAHTWEECLSRHTTQEQIGPMVQDMLEHVHAAHEQSDTHNLLCTMHVLSLMVRSAAHHGLSLNEVAECAKTCMDEQTNALVLAVGLDLYVRLIQDGWTWDIQVDRIASFVSRDEDVARLASFRAVCCWAECTGGKPMWEEEWIVECLHRGLHDTMLPTWDGQILATDARHAPVALWRLITTRWIAVMDAIASDTLLDQLVAFVSQTQAASSTTTSIGMLSGLSKALLSNAQFLELKRWRAAVLRYVHADVNGVHILARVPLEYVPKHDVSLLAPRLWNLLRSCVHEIDCVDVQYVLCRWLVAYPHTMSAAMSVHEYIDAVLNAPLDAWERSSRALYESSCMSLLRAMLQHTSEAPKSVAAWAKVATGEICNKRQLARHALADVCEWTAEHDPTWLASLRITGSVAESVRAALGPIVHGTATDDDALLLRIVGAQLRCTSDLPVDELLSQFLPAIDALCHQSEAPAGIAHALFECLVALAPMLHAHRYIYMACAYAMLSRLDDTLTPAFLNVVENMTPEAYEATLGALVMTMRTDTRCAAHELASFLRVMALLFQHAPPRTSRLADRCFSTLLLYLTPLAERLPSLTPAIVDVVERVCLHRARMLRSLDVSRILALVGVIVSPKPGTAQGTTPSMASHIFRAACASLRALVRHRKDLITPCLPHLTEVVARLLYLLSHVLRAHPGAATLRDIDASLPCWMDIHTLLSPDDAQALTRVLTELAGKTSIAHANKRARHTMLSTTESLAKPMSKHAVYILVAYARCLTMPHTTVPAASRHELMPGLYALCDMCGEHERDAALKSMLDTSAQLIFKSIWTQWDAQRYKGA